MRVLALETSGPWAASRCSTNASSELERRLPDRRANRAVAAALPQQHARRARLAAGRRRTGLRQRPAPARSPACASASSRPRRLAYATGAQLVGVHTLAAIAAGVEQAPPAAAVDSARRPRGELFVALFDFTGRSSDARAARHGNSRLSRLAGPTAARRRRRRPAAGQMARASSPPASSSRTKALWQPTAAAAGRLGVELFHRRGGVDPLELVPQYYRKSAAEEKRKSSPGRGGQAGWLPPAASINGAHAQFVNSRNHSP